MKLRLPNGMVLEGTEIQVRSTVRALGLDANRLVEGQYYDSASRGPILIEDMDTNHIRNAILKLYREWVSSLYHISDTRAVVSAIINGNPDPTFRALVVELSKRPSE